MMDNDGYRVSRMAGCIVVRGPMPVDDMVALMCVWSGHADVQDGDWLIDNVLATAMQATLVCGSYARTSKLRRVLGLNQIDNDESDR